MATELKTKKNDASVTQFLEAVENEDRRSDSYEVLKIMEGFDRYDELMAQLGKFTTGKSCLYLKRLSDVDESVLRELITASCEHTKTLYPV